MTNKPLQHEVNLSLASGASARDCVSLTDVEPALVRSIKFPFPVPDRIPIEYGELRVPFRTNQDDVAYFDLPTRTLR